MENDEIEGMRKLKIGLQVNRKLTNSRPSGDNTERLFYIKI